MATQKKNKKSPSTRDYLPRAGTLPARIFAWLNNRPMLFGELSDLARKETGLEGDDLASQLSAALYDLCVREVVIRIDPRTKKRIPSKGARGALYGLVVKSRALYREHLARASVNGAAHSNGVNPKQLDLSSFSSLSSSHASPAARATVAGRQPSRMPLAMYDALVAEREVADERVRSIDAMLVSPVWN